MRVGIFVTAFAATAVWLLLVYDAVSLANDPLVLFSWVGLSYLMAFSVTESFRSSRIISLPLLACAVGFLAIDLLRHGNLLLQRFGGSLRDVRLLAELSSSTCAISAAGRPLCALTLLVAQYSAQFTIALAACWTILLCLVAMRVGKRKREN
jgi:hypothetical protein